MKTRLVSLEGLLMRPHPEFDESWPGYLCRLADRNLLGGTHALARILNVSKNALLNGRFVNRNFESSLELPVPSNASRFQASATSLSWRARICPICFCNKPLAMGCWDKPLSLRCVVHNCMLLDRCDLCNEIISHDREVFHSCGCGKHFRSLTIQAVPDWVAKLESVYAEAMSADHAQTDKQVMRLQQIGGRGAQFLSQFTENDQEVSEKVKVVNSRSAFLGSENFDNLSKCFTQNEAGFSSSFETWFTASSLAEAGRVLIHRNLTQFKKIRESLEHLRNSSNQQRSLLTVQGLLQVSNGFFLLDKDLSFLRNLFLTDSDSKSLLPESVTIRFDMLSNWEYATRTLRSTYPETANQWKPPSSATNPEIAQMLGLSLACTRGLAIFSPITKSGKHSTSRNVPTTQVTQLMNMLEGKCIASSLFSESEKIPSLASYLNLLCRNSRTGEINNKGDELLIAIAEGRITLIATCNHPTSLRDYKIRSQNFSEWAGFREKVN